MGRQVSGWCSFDGKFFDTEIEMQQYETMYKLYSSLAGLDNVMYRAITEGSDDEFRLAIIHGIVVHKRTEIEAYYACRPTPALAVEQTPNTSGEDRVAEAESEGTAGLQHKDGADSEASRDGEPDDGNRKELSDGGGQSGPEAADSPSSGSGVRDMGTTVARDSTTKAGPKKVRGNPKQTSEPF